MPNTPRDVHVQVFIDDPDANPADFHFETTDLPLVPKNHLHFHNCGHDGLHVYYHLQDPKHGFLFPQESLFPPSPPDQHLSAALYSAVNSPCPTSAGQWGQFKALCVEDEGATLVVHNKNQSQANFGYTLRVVNEQGRYLDLDPGGTNQNGPITMSSSTYLALGAATGVAAGIASALVTTTALVRLDAIC